MQTIIQMLNLPLGTIMHKECSSQSLSTGFSSIDARMQSLPLKCGSLDILGYLMPWVCSNFQFPMQMLQPEYNTYENTSSKWSRAKKYRSQRYIFYCFFLQMSFQKVLKVKDD